MMFTRHHKWRLIVPLVVFVVFVVAALSFATELIDFQGFSLRRNFDLKSDERREGDQMIIGFRVDLQPGSVITGRTTLIGTKVTLDATVAGDVVVIADRLTVGDSAHVVGDLVICSDELNYSDQALIEGSVKRECSQGQGVSVSKLVRSGWDGWRDSLVLQLGGTIAGALLFGALAALGTLFFRLPLVRMVNSMRRAPAVTGGFGFLTIIVLAGLSGIYLASLLLILPVILLPLVVCVWFIVGVLILLGWVALAEPVGHQVFRLLGIDEHSTMITAAVGGITLMLLVRVWGLFWFTAWIGLLIVVVIGSIGLGAVVLTRLGTCTFPHEGTRLVAK